MENDQDRKTEIRKEKVSGFASGTSQNGAMKKDGPYQPHKKAVVVDIEQVIGPRESFKPAQRRPLDHFDKKLFDLEEEVTQPHWAVPWSDIMMVVFVMFAVLFIYSLSKRDVADAYKMPDKTKAETSVQEVKQEMTPEILNEMSRRIIQDTKPDQVSVAVDKAQSLKVSASDSLFFDLGKADLKPDAVRFLENFADVVRKTKTNIRIEGHTDSVPIHSSDFPTNWELSTIRAINIARFLIEENGIEPERFTVVGHSMYRPAVPNNTLDNKAKNRRVEIFISKD